MSVRERIGWVGELLRPRPAPIPWARVVRTGIAVATPVSLGYVVGQLGIGLICSIGALAASLADTEGPYFGRIARIGTVAAAGSAGFVIGDLAFGNPMLTAITVLAGGALAGAISVLGSVASVASLQFLIYLIVASGVSFGSGPRWVAPLCYLVGAAWALALSLSGGIGRRTAPERAAVANVFRALAELMELSGGSHFQDARVHLTETLNAAYDSVVSYRASAAGRDPRVRRLAAVLNASTPIVEAAIALARDGVAVPMDLIARTRATAAAVLEGGGPQDASTAMQPRVSRRPHPGLALVEDGLDAVGGILTERRLEAPVPRPSGARATVRRWRRAVMSGPETWLPTLRLVLCLAVAEAAASVVASQLPGERPYWIPLTVAVTLKPDFGSVFARAVQRGVGTMVGVAVGGALLLVLPGTSFLLVAIGLLAASLPIAQRRNYGMFATFLTPVIVLLLDLSRGGEVQLIVSRVLDTGIGCAIVLVVGYLPWPGTWRSRFEFGARVADVADDVLAYLRVALGLDDGNRRALRRHAYRRLSDLRTLLQQALAEPPLVSRQAAAWWPVIVALERVTDAVTAFVVRTGAEKTEPEQQPGAQPHAPHQAPVPGHDVEQVVRFAGELCSAIREHRTPSERPLPDKGPLTEIAHELRTAASVVTGPT